jgi:predicted phage gp36 major capsid-like protein
MEVVDEIRERVRKKMEEWQRKKEEERRRIEELEKRKVRIRVYRVEVRAVDRVAEEEARKIAKELIERWATLSKYDGTLMKSFVFHMPLRNSYIHATITATISDDNGHNGSYEMHIAHFRYYTMKLAFIASLETVTPSS